MMSQKRQNREEELDRTREAYARRLRHLVDLTSRKQTADSVALIDFISSQLCDFGKDESNMQSESREKDPNDSRSTKINSKNTGLKERDSSNPGTRKRKPSTSRRKERDSSTPKSKKRSSNNRISSKTKEKESRESESRKRSSNNTGPKEKDSNNRKTRKRYRISYSESNHRNSNNSASDISIDSSPADDNVHEMRPQKYRKLSELDWPGSPVPDLIIEYVTPIDKHDEPPEFYRRLLRKARKLYKRLVEGEDVSDVSSDKSVARDIATQTITPDYSETRLREAAATIKASQAGLNIATSFSPLQDRNIEASFSSSPATIHTPLRPIPINIEIPRTYAGEKKNLKEGSSRNLPLGREVSLKFQEVYFRPLPGVNKENKLNKDGSSGPSPSLADLRLSPTLGEASIRSLSDLDKEVRSEDSVSFTDVRQSTLLLKDTREVREDDKSESSETQYTVVTFKADVHATQTRASDSDKPGRYYDKSQDNNTRRAREADMGARRATRSPRLVRSESQHYTDIGQETLEDTAVSATDRIASREAVEGMRSMLPCRAISSFENVPYVESRKDDEHNSFKRYISLERAPSEHISYDMESMDSDQGLRQEHSHREDTPNHSDHGASHGDHDPSHSDHAPSHSEHAPSQSDHGSSHSDHTPSQSDLDSKDSPRKRRSTSKLPSEPKHNKFHQVQTDFNIRSGAKSANTESSHESDVNSAKAGSRQDRVSELKSTFILTKDREQGAREVLSIQNRELVIRSETLSIQDRNEQGAQSETVTTQDREPNTQDQKPEARTAMTGSSRDKPDPQTVIIGSAQDTGSTTRTNTNAETSHEREPNAQSVNEGTSQRELNVQSANEGTTQRESNAQSANEGTSQREPNAQSANEGTSRRESNAQSTNEGTTQRESNAQSANKGTSPREPIAQSTNTGSRQSRDQASQSANIGSNENVMFKYLRFVGRQTVVINCHCPDCPVVARMLSSRR